MQEKVMALKDEAKYAWLACAIDGEGSIGNVIHRRLKLGGKPGKPYYRCRVAIFNNDIRFLERAKEICGCGTIKIWRKACVRAGVKRRESYAFILPEFGQVREILSKVLPYMIVKRRHVGLAIEVCDIMTAKRQRGNWIKGRGSYTPEEQKRLSEIAGEFGEINARGASGLKVKELALRRRQQLEIERGSSGSPNVFIDAGEMREGIKC